MRPNPGPFEPFFYLLQTPWSFRVLGVVGFVLFTLLFLRIAGSHGTAYLMIGFLLLGAFWLGPGHPHLALVPARREQAE